MNMAKPTLEEIQNLLKNPDYKEGNVIPVYKETVADMLTPVSVYLKLTAEEKTNVQSFLFESVAGGEKIGRYSFIGSKPYKTIKSGPNHEYNGDPLKVIEKEMNKIRFVPVPGVNSFTGGAVGYVAYDCIRFFEPKTQRELKDTLGIPDAVFMMFDTIVVFDHLHHLIRVVSHIRLNNESSTEPKSRIDVDILKQKYDQAEEKIDLILHNLMNIKTPMPPQDPILLNQEAISNVGQSGYQNFVEKLKHHINEGDIIQAVPSQRIKKRTTLHPFNAYRQLRSVNPSPYMFYVNLGEFQIVGASPEMLVKVENEMVYTHPIAGTRKRGKTDEEDYQLTQDLLGDMKERAEHIMLVDLGRNDVNRVCRPETVKVDSLMHIEKYSHVMHIVSNVSGRLRSDKSPYDAFRSIFPAGTVSGAPKVKAMELIYELEKEKRGVYAGAVGYFAYSGCIDTAIAIRTMVFKEGYVYLQAGGGIVYDSNPEEEYQETINKLKSNVTAIERAEKHYYELMNSQHEN